jgi:hypothetical protein
MGAHSSSDLTIRVDIPDIGTPYLNAAIVRLSYLHPNACFEVTEGGLNATGHFKGSEASIRRDILFSVYREKIYQETLPMRRQLFDAVLSR